MFVSKYHYGARVPKTVAAFPMVHDTIVGTGIRSYLNKPQLPYLRIPAIKKIKRNDLVTFNWPADTVRRFFVKEAGVVKPIDKKSNYVKRCVAIPGDELEIIDGLLYINNELENLGTFSLALSAGDWIIGAWLDFFDSFFINGKKK